MLNSISGIEISRRLKYNTKTTLSERHFTDYTGLLGVRTQNKKSEGSYIPVPLAFSVDVGPVRGRVVAVSPSNSLVSIYLPPSGSGLVGKKGHVRWAFLAHVLAAQSRVAQSRVAQGCRGSGEAAFLLDLRRSLARRPSPASCAWLPLLASPACMLSEA